MNVTGDGEAATAGLLADPYGEHGGQRLLWEMPPDTLMAIVAAGDNPAAVHVAGLRLKRAKLKTLAFPEACDELAALYVACHKYGAHERLADALREVGLGLVAGDRVYHERRGLGECAGTTPDGQVRVRFADGAKVERLWPFKLEKHLREERPTGGAAA